MQAFSLAVEADGKASQSERALHAASWVLSSFLLPSTSTVKSSS